MQNGEKINHANKWEARTTGTVQKQLCSPGCLFRSFIEPGKRPINMSVEARGSEKTKLRSSAWNDI